MWNALGAVVANVVAYLLLVVLLVAVFRLAVRWARGRRGWRARRQQCRYARQVARDWPALAAALGLTVVEPAQWSWLRARQRPARTLIPAVSVRPTWDGVVVDIACIPGVGLHELAARVDYLANAWGCQRVRVEQTGPGWLRAWGMRVDPLTAPTACRCQRRRRPRWTRCTWDGTSTGSRSASGWRTGPGSW